MHFISLYFILHSHSSDVARYTIHSTCALLYTFFIGIFLSCKSETLCCRIRFGCLLLLYSLLSLLMMLMLSSAFVCVLVPLLLLSTFSACMHLYATCDLFSLLASVFVFQFNSYIIIYIAAQFKCLCKDPQHHHRQQPFQRQFSIIFVLVTCDDTRD